MNTLEHPALLPTTRQQAPVSWTRIGHWLVGAGRILRHAPARLLLLPFLPLMIELLVQQVPVWGVLLSKLYVPIVGAWLLLMVHGRVQGEGFAPWRRLVQLIQRRHAVVTLALIGVGAFGVQCLVASALAGPSAAIGLASNDPLAVAALGRSGLAITLASGAVPMSVLFFVCPHLILSGRGVGASIREGLAKLRAWWPPVLVIMVISAVLLMAVLWQPAILLIMVPLSFLVGYAAYRDAFAIDRA